MSRNSFFPLLTLMVVTFTTGYSQNNKIIQVESWVTNPDRSALFQKQSDIVTFTDKTKGWGAPITIDERQQFQSIDGFGFALTGGSAEHMMKMSDAGRTKLLNELFGTNDNNVGFSYIRLSID